MIGRCKRHGEIDAVPLTEHTMCVSFLNVNVIAFMIFKKAFRRNEWLYRGSYMSGHFI